MADGRAEQQGMGVEIPVDDLVLAGDLTVPRDAQGLVVFAHGSGSSRHSPRNQQVATTLQEAGLATLLMDLLSDEEEAADLRTGHLRFDIGMLADRVAAAVAWAAEHPETKGMPIGCFGASTGAGAALVAAAKRSDLISAVVSRGGRPDLAGDALEEVSAPTLLIVGGEDYPVIEMNQDAMERLHAVVSMEIIPGATHLFEEPGTLEQVAELARDWFRRHLVDETD